MENQQPATTGSGPRIRSNLAPDGTPRVTLNIQETTLVFSPDAAVEVALNMLSAAYAARAEHAVYVHAKQHNMNASELIKHLRNHTDEILDK